MNTNEAAQIIYDVGLAAVQQEDWYLKLTPERREEQQTWGRQKANEHAEKLLTAITGRDLGFLLLTLHTGNRASRQIFEQETGCRLQATERRTRESLRSWYGPDAFDKFLADREQARLDKIATAERLKQEQQEAECQRNYDRIVADLDNGDWIDGDDLVFLARRLGIEVHPRTAGLCYKRVRQIKDGQAKITGKGRVDSAFSLLEECKQKLEGIAV